MVQRMGVAGLYQITPAHHHTHDTHTHARMHLLYTYIHHAHTLMCAIYTYNAIGSGEVDRHCAVQFHPRTDVIKERGHNHLLRAQYIQLPRIAVILFLRLFFWIYHSQTTNKSCSGISIPYLLKIPSFDNSSFNRDI